MRPISRRRTGGRSGRGCPRRRPRRRWSPRSSIARRSSAGDRSLVAGPGREQGALSDSVAVPGPVTARPRPSAALVAAGRPRSPPRSRSVAGRDLRAAAPPPARQARAGVGLGRDDERAVVPVGGRPGVVGRDAEERRGRPRRSAAIDGPARPRRSASRRAPRRRCRRGRRQAVAFGGGDEVVAGRPGDGGDDGPVLAEQGVEQAALARVGAARRGRPGAGPRTGRGARCRAIRASSRPRTASRSSIRAVADDRGDVGLVDEVEVGLELDEAVEQTVAEVADRPGEAAGELAEGGVELAGGRRLDHARARPPTAPGRSAPRGRRGG